MHLRYDEALLFAGHCQLWMTLWCWTAKHGWLLKFSFGILLHFQPAGIQASVCLADTICYVIGFRLRCMQGMHFFLAIMTCASCVSACDPGHLVIHRSVLMLVGCAYA